MENVNKETILGKLKRDVEMDWEKYQSLRNFKNKQVVFLTCQIICEKYELTDLYLFLDDPEEPTLQISVFKDDFEEQENVELYEIWSEIINNEYFDQQDIILLEAFSEDPDEFYSKQLHFNIEMTSANQLTIIDI